MFGDYDKVTLNLGNLSDINGRLLPFTLSLRNADADDFEIPEAVAAIDVFEYQEGLASGGGIVFSIYVGKVDSLINIIEEYESEGIRTPGSLTVKAVDSPVCYQEHNGRPFVFATVNENDLVVNDHEELKVALAQLSSQYKETYKGIQKVKNFAKNFRGNN